MQEKFPSVRAAVRWAVFCSARPALQRSALFGQTGFDDEFTATERRTYASMILRTVEEQCDPVMRAYMVVVWLKPGKLSKQAARRITETNLVNSIKVEVWRGLEAKLVRGERLTANEIKVWDRGLQLEAIPSDLLDPKAGEAWDTILEYLHRTVPHAPRRGLDVLVQRVRGDKIGKHKARQALGVGMSRVDQLQKSVTDALQRLEDRLDRALYHQFSEKGWLFDS